MHDLLFAAGADIIETSSYQASLPGFKECLNIEKDEGEKLIKTSVKLAKKALDQFMAQNSNRSSKFLLAKQCLNYLKCI